MLEAFRVDFEKGFRVGYRRPERVVPAVAVLRALASVASMTGDTGLLRAVLEGRVAASAILPALHDGGRLVPLVPLAPQGVVHASLSKSAGLGRKARLYATLGGARRLAEALDTAGCGAAPCAELVGELSKRLKVVVLKGGDAVLVDDGEEAAVARATPTDVGLAAEHRNAIDRLTSSASPFLVTYAKPRGPMVLLVEHEGLDVERALKLLGELGLGGLRSRGLGRFTARKIDLGESRGVAPLSRASTGRYAVSLGEVPLSSDAVDWRRSFFELSVITGYVGPPYAQRLARPIAASRAGASLYVAKQTYERVEVGSEDAPSTFVFNPLLVQGA